MSSLWANGGGYATGGVSETGTIVGFVPSGTEAVQILEERLDIALKPDAADVEVVYRLKNVTGKNAKVRFGFPVEELDAYDMMEEETEAAPKPGGKLQYCRDYRAEWNGKAIRAKFEAQPDVPLSNPERQGIRGWLISEIEVPAGEPGILGIRYSADYPVESVSVSDDTRSDAKIFQYRLSTGAAWAGPIAKGTISVRADGVAPEDLQVLAPAGRFKKVSDAWQWDFENLEPTLADDLKIQAAPAENVFGSRAIDGGFAGADGVKPVTLIKRGDRWFVQHGNFSKISASSVLAAQNGIGYQPENLADEDWDTVWAEGAEGSGAGEWIEAELEVPAPVRAVQILGGYQTDETLFRNNARPKRVEVILNGEHRMEATLPDKPREVDVPVVGYDRPVKTLRLVIKEVYPGAKWQDCVLTRLNVTTPLAKAPHVQPAR